MKTKATNTNIRLLSSCILLFVPYVPCVDGGGVCHGESTECFTNSVSSCKENISCKWFDFNWVIALLTILSMIAAVSMSMLVDQQSKLKTLENQNKSGSQHF